MVYHIRPETGKQNPEDSVGNPWLSYFQTRGCSKRTLDRDLGDRSNPVHFRHVGLEIPLYTQLQGHAARRTPHARPVQTHFDDPVGGNSDQFDVATIRLNGGSDKVDDLCDAIANRIRGWGSTGAQPPILAARIRDASDETTPRS